MPDSGTPPSASNPVFETGYDAFVSYASADSQLAQSVVGSLERTGLSCWIAPRDVPPGLPYAECIIRAINSARVLVVVLSQNAISSAHVGKEIERASAKQRPIIALRVDGAPLTPALEYFLSESQWIDVPRDHIDAITEPLSKAVRRFAAAARPAGSEVSSAHPASQPVAATRPRSRLLMLVIAVAVLACGAAALLFLQRAPTGGASSKADVARVPAPAAAAPDFAPPPHSIAVLPFVNMSGDPEQGYFSDGLAEELLNSLATIPALHVAARTSSFYFKGKDVDVSEVARKLNVGHVLEGSVRKSGNEVRITAQLIDAKTGFHVWSQTYDRNLKDVLKLQTEIATAVTQALQATLMADAATTIELGGTTNPKALDLFLRGRGRVTHGKVDADVLKAAIADVEEATRVDPKYAKAFAMLARGELGYAEYYASIEDARAHFERARASAEHALELAPDLGIAHSTLASIFETGYYDFKGALTQHARALELAPNDASVLLAAAWFYADIGRADQAVSLAQRGLALDQLNPLAWRTGAIVMETAGRYNDMIEMANRSLALNPQDTRQLALRGVAQIKLGQLDAARQSCEAAAVDWQSQLCLAIVYHKLHRQPDAEQQIAAMRKELGDASSYQYAEIFAQWGDVPRALDAIEAAYRVRDPGLNAMKTDIFVDNLRAEPRFQAILHTLNMPD